ncbi:MAG: dihydroorotate dehydrogenase electron transfer subunit [Chloroflexota bacterium]|nr:dihydroorotate dehydrogenase electron transfer subunit [Chloroflexota bacterium]
MTSRLAAGLGSTVDSDQDGVVVTGARSFRGTVTAIDPVMGDSVLVSMTAPPAMVRQLRSGRFFEILCRLDRFYDPLLRRPYSVFTANPEAGILTFLVRPYGRGSIWLAARAVGDQVDVLGPLGNTYDIAPKSSNVLMVAGGVGVAPLVMLAEEAVATGRHVAFLMGADDVAGLLSPAYLPQSVEYVVATENGSRGHLGFITDLVPEYVAWSDQIFACGPEPMYRSLRATLAAAGAQPRLPIQISMEQNMACGLGACLGCVVETRRGMRTSCVEGPVFDLEDVVW